MAGVEQLLAGRRLGSHRCVMCSESVWWRCHRRLLADHLVLVRGVDVVHLMHDGRRTPPCDHRRRPPGRPPGTPMPGRRVPAGLVRRARGRDIRRDVDRIGPALEGSARVFRCHRLAAPGGADRQDGVDADPGDPEHPEQHGPRPGGRAVGEGDLVGPGRASAWNTPLWDTNHVGTTSAHRPALELDSGRTGRVAAGQSTRTRWSALRRRWCTRCPSGRSRARCPPARRSWRRSGPRRGEVGCATGRRPACTAPAPRTPPTARAGSRDGSRWRGGSRAGTRSSRDETARPSSRCNQSAQRWGMGTFVATADPIQK